MFVHITADEDCPVRGSTRGSLRISAPYASMSCMCMLSIATHRPHNIALKSADARFPLYATIECHARLRHSHGTSHYERMYHYLCGAPQHAAVVQLQSLLFLPDVNVRKRRARETPAPSQAFRMPTTTAQTAMTGEKHTSSPVETDKGAQANTR